MPFYRINGMTIHMRGTKLPVTCGERILLDGKEVVCMAPSAFLCDGPPPTERARDYHGSGTCDRPLCDAHAHETGPNRHLCPNCRSADAEAKPQLGLFTSLVQK